MSPSLAVFLCSLFVISIFWIDKKDNPDISSVSWIPTIWLIYSMSKPLGRWLDVHTTIEAGSPPDRLFLAILIILSMTILLKRKFDWKQATKENLFLILVLGFMLISALWSEVPLISYRRWIKDFSAPLMGFLILSEPDPYKSVIIIFKRSAYVALPISLVLIKYFSIYGRQYNRWTGEVMWVGISTQKNRLALIAAFSIIIFFWEFWQKKWNWRNKLLLIIDIFYMLLALVILLGPERNFKHSATSSICLILALLLLFIFIYFGYKSIKISSKTTHLITISIITIGSLLPFLRKIPLVNILSSFGRDSTLTGRTEIWSMLMPYLQKRPLFGYGRGGFWTTFLRNKIAPHAHNGYLDLMLELGLVGLIIISFFLFMTCKKYIRIMPVNYGFSTLFFCFFFMFIIHNMSESSIIDLHVFPTSLIVLFSLMPDQIKTSRNDFESL